VREVGDGGDAGCVRHCGSLEAEGSESSGEGEEVVGCCVGEGGAVGERQGGEVGVVSREGGGGERVNGEGVEVESLDGCAGEGFETAGD